MKVRNDFTGTKWVISESYKQMSTNKLYNLGEMEKFLETHEVSKLTQEEMEMKRLNQ